MTTHVEPGPNSNQMVDTPVVPDEKSTVPAGSVEDTLLARLANTAANGEGDAVAPVPSATALDLSHGMVIGSATAPPRSPDKKRARDDGDDDDEDRAFYLAHGVDPDSLPVVVMYDEAGGTGDATRLPPAKRMIIGGDAVQLPEPTQLADMTVDQTETSDASRLASYPATEGGLTIQAGEAVTANVPMEESVFHGVDIENNTGPIQTGIYDTRAVGVVASMPVEQKSTGEHSADGVRDGSVRDDTAAAEAPAIPDIPTEEHTNVDGARPVEAFCPDDSIIDGVGLNHPVRYSPPMFLSSLAAGEETETVARLSSDTLHDEPALAVTAGGSMQDTPIGLGLTQPATASAVDSTSEIRHGGTAVELGGGLSAPAEESNHHSLSIASEQPMPMEGIEVSSSGRAAEAMETDGTVQPVSPDEEENFPNSVQPAVGASPTSSPVRSPLADRNNDDASPPRGRPVPLPLTPRPKPSGRLGTARAIGMYVDRRTVQVKYPVLPYEIAPVSRLKPTVKY